MTEAQTALSRRAVACRGWRWSPGMRTLGNMRVIHDPDRWPDRPCAIREGGWIDTSPPRPLGDALPDLQDPATLGCLLALVREALKAPTTHVLLSFGAWYIERDAQDGSEDSEWLHVDGVWGCGSAAIIKANTEAEALVAALEAAP